MKTLTLLLTLLSVTVFSQDIDTTKILIGYKGNQYCENPIWNHGFGFSKARYMINLYRYIGCNADNVFYTTAIGYPSPYEIYQLIECDTIPIYQLIECDTIPIYKLVPIGVDDWCVVKPAGQIICNDTIIFEDD